MINILEKQLIWETLRLHIPMLICASWVIVNQKKTIWDTLKRWWSWGLQKWTKERKDYLIMFALGIVVGIFTIFIVRKTREELTIKQHQEVVEKMLEEKVITPEELQMAQKREREREQN